MRKVLGSGLAGVFATTAGAALLSGVLSVIPDDKREAIADWSDDTASSLSQGFENGRLAIRNWADDTAAPLSLKIENGRVDIRNWADETSAKIIRKFEF